MTRDEAKQVLLCYRPGTADAEDPEVVEAIGMARHDPELAEWFAQHQTFQRAMREKLRQIPVPDHLKMALLTRNKVAIVPIWRRPVIWVAAAASIVLLLIASQTWFAQPVPDRFANYQQRMVSTALRQYRMDIVTPDMAKLRQFLSSSGAPSDYSVPSGLEKLPLSGGGLLRWRSNPVSMVCFDRGDKQMLFLFVMERSAVKDPPPQTPQVSRTSDLVTVSWTQGDRTYLLAGPEEADFARKYL